MALLETWHCQVFPQMLPKFWWRCRTKFEHVLIEMGNVFWAKRSWLAFGKVLINLINNIQLLHVYYEEPWSRTLIVDHKNAGKSIILLAFTLSPSSTYTLDEKQSTSSKLSFNAYNSTKMWVLFSLLTLCIVCTLQEHWVVSLKFSMDIQTQGDQNATIWVAI